MTDIRQISWRGSLLIFCLFIGASSQLSGIPLTYRDYQSVRSPESQQLVSAGAFGSDAIPSTFELKRPGDSLYQLLPIRVKNGGGGGSDCWGWRSPDGIRWAIMGLSNRLWFYDYENSRSHSVPAPDGEPCGGGVVWRDMATYQHYCYAVSECSGENAGIIVMDMSFLPDSVHLVQVMPVSPADTSVEHNNSHNLAVDTVIGTLFVEANGARSAYVYSLADPANPLYSGSIGTGGIHDMHAVNDTVYLAEGGSHNFSIWSRINPLFQFSMIVRVGIPNGGYVHNVWTNHDRTLLASTEETYQKTVKLWDISDVTNIQLVGEYLGPNELAHNVQIEGDRMYISHYAAGVRVVDISDPTNPTEIGHHNTTADPTESGFDGCWGVWPNAGDGWIYASNMDGLIYILKDSVQTLNDSIWIENASALPGETTCLEVHLRNPIKTRSITIPFSWQGELDVLFQGISNSGTRSDGFEFVELTSLDTTNHRGTVVMHASVSDTSIGLTPGVGSILELCFTLPEAQSPDSCVVSFGNSLSADATLETILNYTMLPDTSSGVLSQCLSVSPDSDGDGIGDSCDICPLDSLDDGDGDGLCAEVDNCPEIFNPLQTDSDSDGFGDSCDVCVGADDLLDSDGDGLADGCDECPAIPDPCPCCDVPGDADNSGSTTIGDVTFLISYIFSGGPAPVCESEGDTNNDGTITIGDITFLIANIFSGGPAPVCP